MKNQQFYVKTARLAVPIMMQNMITIGVNMADNIMVGSLGENALSAVALANQFINIYQFSCMGLGQGASIMTSRFWGMKNEKALKQTIAITTRICLVLGILFTVITWCFPEIIMKIFISEPAVISQGVSYLKVLSVSCLLMGLSLAYSNVYRSVGNAKWPLFSSIGAFFLNIGCNYIFIFGKFGAPELGVTGAALGTLIARIFEFVFICMYLIFFDKKIGFRIHDIFMKCQNLMKEYVQISIPVVISDTLYGFGNSAVSMVMGRIGSQFVSANSITLVTQQLSTVFIQGAAQSSSVVVGNTLGEAMYLGKPVLMVPTHIEQSCNAFDAVQAGAGVVADRFDLDALLGLSRTHRPNPAFSHWVKQADWLILREFRPDLLMEETPASLWRRLSTRWIYRLGKTLSI